MNIHCPAGCSGWTVDPVDPVDPGDPVDPVDPPLVHVAWSIPRDGVMVISCLEPWHQGAQDAELPRKWPLMG